MKHWRAALPWALLEGLLIVAAITVTTGLRKGWGTLTELDLWVEKAVIFVIIVLVFTAFWSRMMTAKESSERANLPNNGG